MFEFKPTTKATNVHAIYELYPLQEQAKTVDIHIQEPAAGL